MKSLFLVLALSILLLTSACEPTEKVTVSTNTTKPVAVATNNQIPILAQQLGIDDSINTYEWWYEWLVSHNICRPGEASERYHSE